MKKILGYILSVIVLMYLLIFQPNHSEMTCRSSMCEITTKSILGTTISKKYQNLSSIKNFYVEYNYERWKSRNHKKRQRYYIYAKTKDGNNIGFFENSTWNESKAQNVANALNEALKHPPININIKY